MQFGTHTHIYNYFRCENMVRLWHWNWLIWHQNQNGSSITNLFFALELVFDLMTKYRQQYLTAFGHFEQLWINQLFDANHFWLGQTTRSNICDDFHDDLAVIKKPKMINNIPLEIEKSFERVPQFDRIIHLGQVRWNDMQVFQHGTLRSKQIIWTRR